jgi:quercetin dioxygenase-like cupin family protein
MSAGPMILRQDQQEHPLNVVGMQITILASNAATGSYGLTLQEGAEGTGPPPHRHPWDEAFYVLAGEVRFDCAGASNVCAAGTLVHVPRGTVHAFTFGKGGGRMLEVAGDGAQAAPFFAAIDGEMPPGPPDVPTLLRLAERHGVEFVT